MKVFVWRKEVKASGTGLPIALQKDNGDVINLGAGRHEIAPGVTAVYDPDGFDILGQVTRVWLEIDDTQR